MENQKTYLIAMSIYWIGFGLITICFPSIMNLFHSEAGVGEVTAFSNHIWKHAGFDIMSFSILLLFLSQEQLSRTMLKGVAIAALLPAIIITYSVVATPYWALVFIGAGLGCIFFSVWGFVLSAKA